MWQIFNLWGTENATFWEALTLPGRRVIVFYEEGIQLPARHQDREMIESANKTVCFLWKKNQHIKGQMVYTQNITVDKLTTNMHYINCNITSITNAILHVGKILYNLDGVWELGRVLFICSSHCLVVLDRSAWHLPRGRWILTYPGRYLLPSLSVNHTQIAKFMGPTWGPPGSCRPQMGPMLAPWILLSR